MRRLLLIIISAFGLLSVQAQQVLDLRTGSLTDGVASTVPTRVVETLPDGYRVTYTFKSALLQADDLFKGTLFWKVDGFGLNSTSGDPSTLARNDIMAIPEGYAAVVAVIDSAYRDYHYELTPARQPLIDSGDEVYSKDNVQAIAPYGGYKPQAIVSQEPTQSYRGHDLCLVDVSPIQYSYSDKTVRAYTSITYKVTFVPKVKENSVGAESTPKYVSPDDYFFANNVIGGEQAGEAGAKTATQEGTAKADVKDYLIVSTPKFEEAVKHFADWKRLMGFNVHVELRDDWTSDMVKEAVKDAYNTYPALYYLLIVGDNEDVPAQRSSLIRTHITDFHYGCINENFIPDIYCGRLSVSNEEQAIIVVNKIIGYEQTPPLEKAFYNKGLHCAYFQDSDSDGYEDTRFTRTSEDVYAYLTHQDKKIERVYAALKNVTPLYWSNCVYAYGEPIPNDLKKPAFSWDGNGADITTAINSGVFYVLHRDHGLLWGWGVPQFTKTDVLNLSNVNLLPIVFSINCRTGQFGEDCFAESFLRNPNGGCVAIYAASEVSYSGDNDALTTGMFDAIWPEPGLSIKLPGCNKKFSTTPLPTYALGQILNQGMFRLSETYGFSNAYTKYDKEIFHCFGDPSMKIYTESPVPFSNVSIKRGMNEITVQLKAGEMARVTVYNQDYGVVQSYIGDSVIVATPYPDESVVCVSAHNRIPYIQYPDVKYIQNEKISGKLDERHDVIKVGNHVTSSMLPGDVSISNADVVFKARRVLLDSGTYISLGNTMKVNPK